MKSQNLLKSPLQLCAAKSEEDLSLFAENGQMTRCEESMDMYPVSIGSDFYTPFTVVTMDSNAVNGYAGVKRFSNQS